MIDVRSTIKQLEADIDGLSDRLKAMRRLVKQMRVVLGVTNERAAAGKTLREIAREYKAAGEWLASCQERFKELGHKWERWFE
jgi:hypothetical protein